MEKEKEMGKNFVLVFEGEFIDGERNGKGKEYNLFSKLRYEGEYLNGQRIEKKTIIFCF